jgi:hypothetical protein
MQLNAISPFKNQMKIINLTFINILFLISCGHRVEKNSSLNSVADSSTDIQRKAEEENYEPDIEAKEENYDPNFKKLRKEYVANYHKIRNIDTSFTDIDGKQIHIQTKYYCLFDNAVIIPKQYVLEDTTQAFITHNYSQHIKIVVDRDTIFNRTITKTDFADKLSPELKQFAVLMFPTFRYDKEKNIFDFGYSLTIPITDLGSGWRLQIDKKGNMVRTDR